MIRTDFPFAVDEIENAWMTLADGTRLAVRLWLPEGSLAQPVPAILEYLPYRKDDATAWQDSTRHPYFAGHGYAAVRVDIRGSGDSDGILYDEYLKQEQDDALEVIAWIAEQPWCSGRVGMIGYSWGGFNGLQVAARRPPALGAIVTAYSTDDRYTDDCHYQGGCVLGSDLLKWASTMRAINALPPDPRFREDWREVWLDRLERTPPYIDAWLSHQRYDEFWKQGSVAEDYEAIEAAVYAVGGWADAYTNAVPRLIENLSCPRKGLIGPWKHILPYRGEPEPAIGFLQECVRWFDHHLKGIDNGIDAQPIMSVWMQESVPPATDYSERPGRWIAGEGWPIASVRTERWALTAGGALLPQPVATTTAVPLPGAPDAAPAGAPADAAFFSAEPLTITGHQWTGVTQGVWCANGMEGELPGDQRPDDERSLLFDSAPLPERIEILGTVEVDLDLASDRPLALVAARLCDVAPDGASTLVTWGMLNLTHRSGHESPEPLEPGRRYSISFGLNVIGQAVPAGHRLRLALSPTYWPNAWPSPEETTLSIFADGTSQLRIPLHDRAQETLPAPQFGPPERARPLELFAERAERSRVVETLPGTESLVMRDREVREQLLATTGTRDTEVNTETWTVEAHDSLSAGVRCERIFELEREGWSIRIRTTSEMTSDATHFLLTDSLEAFERDQLVYGKSWNKSIPRDFV